MIIDSVSRVGAAAVGDLLVRIPTRGRVAVLHPIGHLHRATWPILLDALRTVEAEDPAVIVMDLDNLWIDDELIHGRPGESDRSTALSRIPLMLVTEDEEQASRMRSSGLLDGFTPVHRDIVAAMRHAVTVCAVPRDAVASPYRMPGRRIGVAAGRPRSGRNELGDPREPLHQPLGEVVDGTAVRYVQDLVSQAGQPQRHQLLGEGSCPLGLTEQNTDRGAA